MRAPVETCTSASAMAIVASQAFPATALVNTDSSRST